MPLSAINMRGARILIVEDEYLLAAELRDRIEDKGGVVIGPVATLSEAMALILAHKLDGAIVDIDLRGEWSYPLLDQLIQNNVYTIITTGCDLAGLPVRFRRLPILEKPCFFGNYSSISTRPSVQLSRTRH